MTPFDGILPWPIFDNIIPPRAKTNKMVVTYQHTTQDSVAKSFSLLNKDIENTEGKYLGTE